jgi:hypothetical protein
MTVRIQKPAFNIREKLSELDFGHVPYEKMPAGSVIQIVQVLNTTDTRITTNSINFITASIQPRSSKNKILIMGNLASVASRSITLAEGFCELHKNGVSLGTFDGISPWNGTNEQRSVGSISVQYLDSPNTSNSTTYALNIRTTQGQFDINDEGGISSLTLLEIAS